MSVGTTTIALVLIAGIFAYLTNNLQATTHGAVLTFLNLILTYITIGLALFAALQTAHHTYLQPGLLQGFINIYWLITTFLIGWTVWHVYITLTKQDSTASQQ